MGIERLLQPDFSRVSGKEQYENNISSVSCIDQVASRSYLALMRAVGLKVLKNKLSEYVRLAASGETVLITDRDRIVAELTPPREQRSPFLADAMLAEAVRKGWITPAVFPPGDPPPRQPIVPFEELMEELQRDREDR